MDIPRGEATARRRRLRRILCAVTGLVVVALVTVGLSRLEPAAHPFPRRAFARGRVPFAKLSWGYSWRIKTLRDGRVPSCDTFFAATVAIASNVEGEI